MPATKPYETKTLSEGVDATAPDGTAVRLLLSLEGGSMAHFELPAGAVSHAVTHRTVEEIWFVVWRKGRHSAAKGTSNPSIHSGLGRADHPARPLRVSVSRPSRFGPSVRRDHHASVAWHGRGRGRAGPMVCPPRGRLAALLRAARLADSAKAAEAPD